MAKTEPLVFLRRFCKTERQREVVEAVIETGSRRQAAKKLNCTLRNVFDVLRRVKKFAALRGVSPAHDMTHEIAPGQRMRGISTHYNAQGGIISQWVKTADDAAARAEIVESMLQGMAQDLKGAAPVVAAPRVVIKGRLAVYIIADLHLGLFAWGKETGGPDYDIKIATQVLDQSLAELVAATPRTERALIVQLGDFFHTDTVKNQTLAHKNILDVDSRWRKILFLGLHSFNQLTLNVAKKHRQVDVINAIGNHDEHSSAILTGAMDYAFKSNRRVRILDTPNPFNYYQWEKCLFGITHGFKSWPALPGIMAEDQPEAWGASKYRRWLLGHTHHHQVKEFPGAVVEGFRAICPADAWHNRRGYRSRSEVLSIVCAAHGEEVERHMVDPFAALGAKEAASA